MFHLTNKAWTPYRYYSCHSSGDGWGLVLHACWRQGQGLVMGINSKNILKCVKHLVASIKIIWLVLLLDWDLDLWFSAEIHSWPRTSTGMGVTWAAAGPTTVANSNGYSSHLNSWSQQQSPHCCSALCLRLNLKDLGFGNGAVLLFDSCKSQPMSWERQRQERATVLLLLWNINSGENHFLSVLSGHTDYISRGLVRSLPCSGTCVCCLWENRDFCLWSVRSSGVKLLSCRSPLKMSFKDATIQTEPVHSICLCQECEHVQY